jgi:hypothetical protein
VLARVDLVHDWITQQIQSHGGGGGGPAGGDASTGPGDGTGGDAGYSWNTDGGNNAASAWGTRSHGGCALAPPGDTTSLDPALVAAAIALALVNSSRRARRRASRA